MNKIQMEIKQTLKKFISSFLGLCFLCLSCTACERTPNGEFPVFSTSSNTEISLSNEADITSKVVEVIPEPVQLTVASTLSSIQLNELARLYTAKVQQSSVRNPDYSQAYLETVIPLFTVQAIETPLDGVKIEDMQKWNYIPDIIYVNELIEPIENKLIRPITEQAAENPLFSPAVISKTALDAVSIERQLYGIPFRTSTMLLYSNLEVLDKAGLQGIPVNLDMNIFLEISEKIFDMLTTEIIPDQEQADNEMSNEADTVISIDEEHETALKESIYPFYLCRDLLPFLSSSFDSDFEWFARKKNSFAYTSDAFLQSVSFLRDYSISGYSVDHLSQLEMQTAFDGEDPKNTGRVAMWVGDTKDLEKWSDSQSIFLSQIPSSPEQIFTPPALTIYPLCISAETKYPELAVDFAAFLALDIQALMYEFQNDANTGYFPAIDTESLWMSIFLESNHLDMFLFLRENLRSAYYNPYTNEKSVYRFADSVFTKYESAILRDRSDLNTILISMQEESFP